MSTASSLKSVIAMAVLFGAMQLCLAEEPEVEHSSFLSSAPGASVALHQVESTELSHAWSDVAGVWWAKKGFKISRSGFKKGFFTGLCIAWVVGGSGLILAILSGFYTLASHFSWHSKVKGGPMLPLHRLGCA
jgi:hypothetical protein